MSRKILSLTLSISLLFQYSGFAQSINLADYLSQGHNVVALDRFRPLALRYFSYEPSADNFKILLDKGDQKNLSDTKIKDEADRLLTYFKIGLTLPNEKFWVNLRPDAADQIIDPELEKTDLGKVLLEADLQLKKDTSSLTSPQSKEGKVYWEKLYKKAGELFGTENITIPTITRPWIVPGEIIVRESKDSAYIYKAVLKVMLEEDYLRGMKGEGRGTTASYSFKDPRLNELNKYSTELIRETILPELTKRINSSKDYANLRQVFFSLILARWFKDSFSNSGSVSAPENSYVKLIDSQDLTNLTSKESWSKTAYFNEYKKSFAQGEYNLSEKIHTPTGQAIRRYTSGGMFDLMNGERHSYNLGTANSSIAAHRNMVEMDVAGNLKVGSPLVEDKVWAQELEELQKLKGRGLFGLIEKAIEKIPGSDTQISDGDSKQRVFKIPSPAYDIFISYYLITPGKDDTNHYKNNNVEYRTIEIFHKNSNNRIALIRAYNKNDEISVPVSIALSVVTRDHISGQLIDALITAASAIEHDLSKAIVTPSITTALGSKILKEDHWAEIDRRGREKAKETTSSAVEETKKFAGDKFAPIYYFGDYGKSNAGLPKGGAKDKELLGGKGANLAEMANYISEQHPELELNVPPGFTVTAEQTKNWNARKKVLSDELMREMRLAIHKLEETMGRKLGDTENLPLLVAVRSGAKKSMPGMMDTILNLGLNDKSVLALARAINERFAWDCYRRFFEMYGRTVLGVKEDDEKRTGFKHILEEMVIRQAGRKDEYGLNVAELKELVELYKQEIQRQGLPAIPEDPYEQYRYAVEAVFRSSYNDRAMTYRVKEGFKLEETLSAVNVMPMVFGNLDDNSGAGVAFSRNLQNGERKITVEYNINCQGEDVVAGRKKGLSLEELEKRFPEAARSLKAILAFLELHYKDVQDVEFTIENGKLWILQARSAKRTSRAEVKTAMDMYAEGLLKTPEEVIALITPDKMAELLVSQFDKNDKKKAVNEERLLSDGGLDASPGAGVGRNVFDSDRAKELRGKIEDIITRINNNGDVTQEEKELVLAGIILVRDETSPEDLDGMLASVGIWTKKGGRTSHAAVVARQFGIAAVVGDDNIEIDVAAKTVTVTKADGSKQVLREGDIVSLDGTGEKGRGQVFIEEIKTVPSFVTTAQYKESLALVKNAVRQLEEWKKNITGEQDDALRREYDKHIKIYQEHIAKYEQAQLAQDEWDFYRQYQTLNQMANKVRKERGGLGVGGNAEKPLDVLNAVLNGAENFGLVRTEHMFSGDGRELKVQKMILAKTKQKRVEALKELLPLQQVDFEQIFIFADGRPVTIRLIDPPLHEFLPKKEEKIQELADALGLDIQEVKSRIDALHEDNPMFGVRGVRLSVLFPEIIEMQVSAIFNAVNKARAAGIKVEPQIMVPLVGNVKEFLFVKQRIEKVAGEAGVKRDSFQIGTMIEIVAGAMNIAEIAREVEFISFGTNDLTQGILKISRDDGKEWLRKSLAAEIFEDDPFEALSPEVALFIKRVIEQARAANPKIKIGICGEQGVNVKSIEKYLAPYGLNYVSGGSRRIPGALMAAAKESVKGYKPLEPKAKEEVKIEKKEFPELTSIKGVKDSHGQFREAVAYVREKGHTIEAKKAALANIDLTKPMWNEGDLLAAGGYDEVISWAKELTDMEVTIRVDKSEEKIGAIVGMIDTEQFLFSNGGLRFEIQELLLDNDVSEQKRQNKMEIFKKAFVSYLKYTTAKSWEFSVKLPDFALGTIFEYETKQDQEAAIKNLAAALKIEEKEIEARIAQYREANRAIGTRGMRAFFLRNVVPLYAAMAQAALNAAKENGIENVDFILPFLVNGKELKAVLDGYMTDKGETIVSSLRESLKEVKGVEGVNYRFGAVIETPAACVTAEDLAKTADFFVVDAKKLTEAVWAAFEGDTRKGFFDAYLANGIWDRDIFKYAPIETRLLIQEAVNRARAQKNNLEVRVITDPHDADLIELSQNLKVNSLIVGPGEDDLAILAAAQAAIKYPAGASSSMVETGAVDKNPAKVVGGIDFRSMNMLIQPQGSFASSSLDFSLPVLSRAEIEAFDLDKELELIQRMASSGIDPVDERLKKYLAVCFARGRTGKEIDELKLCLEDVFTAQQLDARETPDGYKEVIVIADTRRYVLKESRLAAGKVKAINLN